MALDTDTATAPDKPDTPPAGVSKTVVATPDRSALLGEAYKRGIFPQNQRLLYELAQKRGLVSGGTTPPEPSKPLSDIGTTLEANANKYANAAGEAYTQVRGFEPDIDYHSGVDFLAQAVFQKADNPQEAQAILGHLFGPQNIGQDQAGRWWVKKDGRKIAVFAEPYAPANAATKTTEGVHTNLRNAMEFTTIPYPFNIITAGLDQAVNAMGFEPMLRRYAAGTLATAPETVGAIGGAAAASETGPIGMAVGAGAGGTFGKLVDELYKASTGNLKKTPAQGARALESTFALNALLEGGGQTLQGARSAIREFLPRFFGATPETSAMSRQLLASGARPPLVSAAPKGKVFQYDQALRNMLKGNPQEGRNVAYIESQIRDMLKRQGLTDDEIEHTMSEVSDTSSAVSKTDVGAQLVSAVKAHKEALEKGANDALDAAT